MSQQRLSHKRSHHPNIHDEILLKHVGSTVRKYRISKDIDIEYLSKESGLDKGIISDLENGIADIYLNDLSSIARALGIDTVALVDIPPY